MAFAATQLHCPQVNVRISGAPERPVLEMGAKAHAEASIPSGLFAAGLADGCRVHAGVVVAFAATQLPCPQVNVRISSMPE